MKCGMCESHENDAVRKVADVKKVRSSRVSGLTEIICDDNTDVDKIVSAIKNDGYDVKEVNVSDFEKHGLFLKFYLLSFRFVLYKKYAPEAARVFLFRAEYAKKRLTGCQPFGFDAVIRCHPVCFPVFRRFFRSPFQIARVFLRHHRFLQRCLR